MATPSSQVHRERNARNVLLIDTSKWYYNADRVKTLGESVLGFTLGCAQCHNHKFDPITQKDYYQMFAFFKTLGNGGLDGNGGINLGPSMKEKTVLKTDEPPGLEKQIAALKNSLTQPDSTTLKAWEQREQKKLAARGQGLKLHPVKVLKISTPNRGSGQDVDGVNGIRLNNPGDISKESKATLEAYGPEVHRPGNYAYNCLLARRLLVRNVRFVQLFHRGWDQHIAINRQIPNQCRDIDQPTAALIKDLKQRGLLEDTLVVFATEFGRTVFSQGKLGDPGMGRDHHGRSFTVWLAGGGIKGGMEYGATDDFCYNIAENPVHIRDLHATILHCLGIDHQRFTHKFRSLNVRLTGVEEAHLVKGILA